MKFIHVRKPESARVLVPQTQTGTLETDEQCYSAGEMGNPHVGEDHEVGSVWNHEPEVPLLETAPGHWELRIVRDACSVSTVKPTLATFGLSIKLLRSTLTGCARDSSLKHSGLTRSCRSDVSVLDAKRATEIEGSVGFPSCAATEVHQIVFDLRDESELELGGSRIQRREATPHRRSPRTLASAATEGHRPPDLTA
jgi:hypothetical protein